MGKIQETGGVCGITGDFLFGSARVLSKFTSVTNLVTRKAWCVTLAPLRFGVAPNRILLPESTFASLNLSPDSWAEVWPNELRCESGRYELQHRPVPAAARIDLPSRARLEEFRVGLTRYGVGAAAFLLADTEDVPFPEATVGARARRLPQRSAAERLLGLGNGYTPSGDDILAGYLGACMMLAKSVPGELQGLGMLAIKRTTPLSATTIRFAEAGFIEGRLEATIAAICNDDEEDLDVLLRSHIGQVGHSSGSDTLLGVYLAVTHFLGV